MNSESETTISVYYINELQSHDSRHLSEAFLSIDLSALRI